MLIGETSSVKFCLTPPARCPRSELPMSAESALLTPRLQGGDEWGVFIMSQ